MNEGVTILKFNTWSNVQEMADLHIERAFMKS